MSETFEWIDADGASLTISGPGITTYAVEMPASGRYMPKIRTQSDGVPGQPGGRWRRSDHDVRDFVLPLAVAGTSEANLRALLRDLMYRMDPTRGQGRIRVTSPAGDQREITCLYAAGLEGDEKEESTGLQFQSFPLAMTAYDPYWYDVSPTSETFTTSAVAVFFPIFPLRLTASQLVVDDSVTNAGDVDAWPVWTITGPGSSIKLTNLTTSQSIYFPSLTLGNDETITVDTRPNIKSVLLGDGTNMYPYLDSSSFLWALRRGGNAIRLEMTGADYTSTSLTISFYQRWLSP